VITHADVVRTFSLESFDLRSAPTSTNRRTVSIEAFLSAAAVKARIPATVSAVNVSASLQKQFHNFFKSLRPPHRSMADRSGEVLFFNIGATIQ
jgi:hypothetical protein